MTGRLAIVELPVESLIPYARNARTHTDEQVAQIAASIREWGWTNPVLVDEAGGIIAGHGRVLAARKLGRAAVPCITLDGLSEAQKRAYVLADNKLALNAGWDLKALAIELSDLETAGFDVGLVGFSEQELADILAEPAGSAAAVEVPIPDVPEDPVSDFNDVWLLGKHRVMCGDSTNREAMATLMDGAIADLLHADPPYGMGKEADGVANDNLYGDKLDAFQMSWWRTVRPFLSSNASAYVWGNPLDLWRLWYGAGLGATEKFELRNEIVWDKKAIPGMASPELTQYPIASERCLFFQFGTQFIGNINTTDFPESWEPLRAHLEAEANAAGIDAAQIKRICGCGMYGHWFSRSQFTLIPQKHYTSLASAYPGHFAREWSDLKREWDQVKAVCWNTIERSYFDNAHDSMRDVWEFPRVTGAERHEHATPKPVAMMERAIKSSLQTGGIVVEPFGGTGPTLLAAESCGRVCYSMEMQPQYVDVIIERWQSLTGQAATLEGDGRTFAELAHERVKVAA